MQWKQIVPKILHYLHIFRKSYIEFCDLNWIRIWKFRDLLWIWSCFSAQIKKFTSCTVNLHRTTSNSSYFNMVFTPFLLLFFNILGMQVEKLSKFITFLLKFQTFCCHFTVYIVSMKLQSAAASKGARVRIYYSETSSSCFAPLSANSRRKRRQRHASPSEKRTPK